MIDPAEIQEFLDREPFESFLIRMTDGKEYDVINPSLAVAMQGTLFLATPARDRIKLLSYRNMTTVESQARAE